ncbi:hypothetical protein ACVWZX_005249, partial [Deinococcus sp. UYEF24]
MKKPAEAEWIPRFCASRFLLEAQYRTPLSNRAQCGNTEEVTASRSSSKKGSVL